MMSRLLTLAFPLLKAGRFQATAGIDGHNGIMGAAETFLAARYGLALHASDTEASLGLLGPVSFLPLGSRQCHVSEAMPNGPKSPRRTPCVRLPNSGTMMVELVRRNQYSTETQG